MELTGINSEGKLVKSGVLEFAKANMKEEEGLVGLGQTPHSVVYVNKATQKTREVDLRELATYGGLNDVKFNFDRKMAKDQGWLREKDIDQGIAYNLERIKTVEGREKYLQSKGVQNFFHDKGGDDYFVLNGGRIETLNNKDGFDLSDLTRMAAHAGRDVGAIGAVGLTGVGAAATGGTSLFLASTAAAGGAVIGEGLQRVADKVLGADAAKFNAEMSMKEEGVDVLKTGGVGALSGLGGQAGGMILGKTMVKGTQIAKAVSQSLGVAEEWFAKQAAKSEASYLAAQMPQGWLKGKLGTSAEEAVAREALNKAQAANTAKAAEMALEDAKIAIAPGRSKLSADPVKYQEDMKQFAMRQQFKAQEAAKQAQQETEALTTYADKEAVRERFDLFKEKMTQNAYDVYGKDKHLVDEILREGGDAEAARKAFGVVEAKMVQGLRSKGINVEVDAVGTIVGLEKESSQAYIQKTLNSSIDESSAYVDQIARQAFQMDKVPSDQTMSLTVSAVKSVINAAKKSNVDDKTKEFILNEGRDLVKAISRHDVTGGLDTGFQMTRFLEVSRQLADNRALPPSFHNAVRTANERLYRYAGEASKYQNAVKDLGHLQDSVLAMRATRRNQVYDQEGGTEYMLKQLADLETMTGSKPKAANDIATILHYEDMLANSQTSKFWSYMNEGDKARLSALQLLRSEVAAKKVGAAKEKGPGAMAGAAFGLAAEVMLGGGPSLVGAVLGGGAFQAAKTGVVKTAGKKVASGAATTVKAGGKIVSKPLAQRTAASYGIAESDLQKLVGKKLQNWTGTGNNED